MSDSYIQKGLLQSGRAEQPHSPSGVETNPKAAAAASAGSAPSLPPQPSSSSSSAACAAGGPRTAPGRGAVSPQHQQQLQLLAATGGAEGACYKCLAPFGVALLVSGAAVSAVAYSRNAHGSPITLLGLALLGLGALLGALGALGCLLHRHRELSRARRESRTTLVGATAP